MVGDGRRTKDERKKFHKILSRTTSSHFILLLVIILYFISPLLVHLWSSYSIADVFFFILRFYCLQFFSWILYYIIIRFFYVFFSCVHICVLKYDTRNNCWNDLVDYFVGWALDGNILIFLDWIDLNLWSGEFLRTFLIVDCWEFVVYYFCGHSIKS